MLLWRCRILLSNLMFHVAWTFSFANQYMGNITKCRPFQLSELMNFSWWICFRMTYSIHSYVIDTTRCKKDFSQQNYWLLRIQPYSRLCTSLCFWNKICKEVSFFFLDMVHVVQTIFKNAFFMKSEIQQKQAFWFCFTQLFMSLLLKQMTIILSHNFLQNGIMCM